LRIWSETSASAGFEGTAVVSTAITAVVSTAGTAVVSTVGTAVVSTALTAVVSTAGTAEDGTAVSLLTAGCTGTAGAVTADLETETEAATAGGVGGAAKPGSKRRDLGASQEGGGPLAFQAGLVAVLGIHGWTKTTIEWLQENIKKNIDAYRKLLSSISAPDPWHFCADQQIHTSGEWIRIRIRIRIRILLFSSLTFKTPTKN
jgi:hypothetical protein